MPRLISFIIPAHNEETHIGATVRAIRTAAEGIEPRFEIIVVDDSSTDRTATLAAAEGARVVRATCRKISGSRNAGAAVAEGDLFVFVDADTIVSRDVVRATISAIDAGAAAGGCRVAFDEPIPWWVRFVLPPMLAVYRFMRLAAGCYLFCTREAFEAAGGFDESIYAGEEVFMSRALGRQGRFVVLRETVVTSARKLRTHTALELLTTLLRLGFAGRRGVGKREGLDLWYGPRRLDPRE